MRHRSPSWRAWLLDSDPRLPACQILVLSSSVRPAPPLPARGRAWTLPLLLTPAACPPLELPLLLETVTVVHVATERPALGVLPFARVPKIRLPLLRCAPSPPANLSNVDKDN